MNQPKWIVKKVQANKDYTLMLEFNDGSIKIYDAKPLLELPIYKELNSLDFFMKVRVCCGTVSWSDEIDLAPEHLYECSKGMRE